MAIVLRRANGDIIWFDAITEYNTTYSASVTKHPVATGGYVADHVTTDNVVLQISGIFSDADFNLSRQLVEVRSADGTALTPNKQFQNNTQTVYPVTITDTGSINKYLPEVIAQFTKDSIPTAYVTPQDKAKAALVVKSDLIKMWKDREEFQVLDISGNNVAEEFSPCVFTNVSFREDESTGEGVFPVMTIEQVVFTDVKEISVKIKTSNKGRKSGTATTKPVEVPPDNEVKSFTKLSASELKSTTTTGGQ
jgi:hypothetical protein